MNRIDMLEVTTALYRMDDGSYADVRINGADVAALLAVAKSAVELCRGSMVPEQWIKNKIALEKAVAAIEAPE